MGKEKVTNLLWFCPKRENLLLLRGQMGIPLLSLRNRLCHEGPSRGPFFVRRVSGRHSFGLVSLRGGCNQFLSSSPILVESSRVKRSHGGCLVRNFKIGIQVLVH